MKAWALRVFHHVAERPEFEGKDAVVAEIKEATAMVAELIEAASDPVLLESASDGNWRARLEAQVRLARALLMVNQGAA